MIPFEKSRLMKPIDDTWDIEDPVWIDDDTVSFCIPTWFEPEEFFEGLDVNSIENDDYINVYLYYHFNNENVELILTYVNESGYDDGYNDFEIAIEIDEVSKELFKEKIRADWIEILKEDCDSDE